MLKNSTRLLRSRTLFASRAGQSALAALALLAFAAAPLHLAAQQAHPSSPYGAYGGPYGGQYAQPAPQYGYAQPQYQQPQYAPQQPYAQPPYPQQQPYANQPYEPSPYPDQQDFAPQGAAPVQALSAEQLEQLLAPIALYPDALLAQILAASTYPAQVAVADQWLQQMRASGYGSPDQIAAGAQAQTSWDPSIKALTAFPDVLDMLNQNLEWTTDLGNAYYNQPQDVMQTVQVLRQRAEQAGNLQSTPQEDVTNDQGYIQLAPADPNQVYVPTYDPWAAYGQPISPYPGFSFAGALANFFTSGALQYGLSFALGPFGRLPFGWLAWGLDWLGQAVLFDHSCYYTHSFTVADWGLPHGGPRAYWGRGEPGRMRDGPNRSWGERQGFNDHGNQQRGDGQRGGWNNNRGPQQSYTRPGERFPEPGRSNNNYNNFNRGYQDNRGYQQPGYGYSRPGPTTQQNYGYRPQTYPNRAQSYLSRPQTSGNFGYGYGYANRSSNAYPGQAYGTRPGFSYANPYSNYRAPQSNSSRAYRGYGNSQRGSGHSGGFHLFGHNSEPRGFSGGGHESFGGGHAPKFSSGGGHGKAPKMSHSGGGGGRHRF
jgi:hypothetical protein